MLESRPFVSLIYTARLLDWIDPDIEFNDDRVGRRHLYYGGVVVICRWNGGGGYKL